MVKQKPSGTMISVQSEESLLKLYTYRHLFLQLRNTVAVGISVHERAVCTKIIDYLVKQQLDEAEWKKNMEENRLVENGLPIAFLEVQ